MSSLRQFLTLVLIGVRGMPNRPATSLVLVVGVALVVAVFVSVLALAAGFQRTARLTGHTDRAVILREGTSSEAASSLSQQDLVSILNAPGIRSPAGKPLASAESLAFVTVPDRKSGHDAFVTLRGVGPEGLQLRPEVQLVQGRLFERGARELVVGRAAFGRLSGLAIGSVLSLPQGEWRIVGVFESGGDSHESELLTDAATLMSAYQRKTFNSITVALARPEAFSTFHAALAANPMLAVDILREDAYFAQTSQSLSDLLLAVAYGIGGIMALGASLGAINTMYTVTSVRSSEIATLRAIGFGARGVVASVLAESLLLASFGALIGAGLARLAIHGSSVSTMAGGAPSQVTFALEVTPAVVATGVLAACVIGMIGGLVPAARVGRLPVATALRG